MFDVGFSELLVIAVVALVVIGPERLPGVARTVGALLGRAQRYFNSVKAEVNRELQLEELKRIQKETYDRVMAMEAEVAGGLAQAENAIHQTVAEATAVESAPVPAVEAPATLPEAPVVVADAAVAPAISPEAPPAASSDPIAAKATLAPATAINQGDLFGGEATSHHSESRS